MYGFSVVTYFVLGFPSTALKLVSALSLLVHVDRWLYGRNCSKLMLFFFFSAYGASYGTVPTSAAAAAAASMVATSGGYADYNQMSAAPQAGMPAGAPGAQPRLETPTATDYSAYGEISCTIT